MSNNTKKFVVKPKLKFNFRITFNVRARADNKVAHKQYPKMKPKHQVGMIVTYLLKTSLRVD